MKNNNSIIAQTAVIILAAGKGTRMGNVNVPKICFEIDGTAAINLIIRTFRKQGFEKFVLVVGANAEKVMETVSAEFPETVFVLQQPQLGTGHAAKTAANALENIGHTGPVLITMGDKYVEPEAINLLVDGFVRKQADLALLTIPKTKRTDTSCGRVLTNSDGNAFAIIERIDIARQAICDTLNSHIVSGTKLSSSQVKAIIQKHIPQTKKQLTAVPELLELIKKGSKIKINTLKNILNSDGYSISIKGKSYSARQIEQKSKQVNPSLYLANANALYSGLSLLRNDNAQKEYYLTDIVSELSNTKKSGQGNPWKIIAVHSDSDTLIQGFNSPDELLAIQDYLRKNKQTKKQALQERTVNLSVNEYCTVRQWQKKIDAKGTLFNKWLKKIYGGHEDLHKKKITQIKKLLKCYGQKFGYDDKVVIVRAPGRVNLMGRHIDHRGGTNNFLAIDKETMVVAGIRNDDVVHAVNTQPKAFKDVHFCIGDMIGRFAWSDWLNFVNSDWVRSQLITAAGDWGNYIKAAALRIQHSYTDLKIKGMNLVLSGDVPIAAGLSSSSTIVVATLQALIALNGFELTTKQFIDLCGTGEWFVGSRGGAGDHAAIYLGQRGKIVNVSNLPFEVNTIVDAPEDYQVVIANSHIKAAKSASARDAFNKRICSYNLGLELVKLRCPEIANRIECLRHLSPENLGCSVSDIYRYLLKIPQFVTRKQLLNSFPQSMKETVELNMRSHNTKTPYNLRGVLLYGMSEILRSQLCVKLLQENRISEFGDFMKISHEGDRVVKFDDNDNQTVIKDVYSDQTLRRLIGDLSSEEPRRVLDAQLYMQPGSYLCSTPEIDRMVDIAVAIDGVAGAQIAGAGLGGCIMVLVKKNSYNKLKNNLTRHYYKPGGLKPEILLCKTVEGAGLIQF